ncbi:ABC transporter substrate-binding protein [Paraburkholderia sp. J67]|uniref:ABC transporter substrate-binding protein n=1 Tax=Paraburkholderia sp. J67 TaxID=2805435 RepID=UPI002ABE1184|nr:ABC transporter substrate-binding protein [Paraburkholderia sp. J67]
MTEKYSIVLGRHGQVEDLRSGAVRLEGVDLDFIDIKRMPDAYRSMARSQPYDICEMAPTSYLMALAAGAPVTALALPMTRRFRHAGLQRLKDSTIRHPKDLEGRSIGVRAYSVTAAVWTRGILADEYGVDFDKVTWLTEEDENVESFVLPSNVRRVASGTSLAQMMNAGELEAGFGGLAGVGADLDDRLVDLVDNAASREADWYRRTGIYPLHGVIVVRNELLARDPDLPRRLFVAFTAAKENYLARVKRGEADSPEDRRYRQLAEQVGDPLPYGLVQNEKSFEALVQYAHAQRLIATRPPIADAFIDPSIQ